MSYNPSNLTRNTVREPEEIDKFIQKNKFKFVYPMCYDGDELNTFHKEWDSVDLKCVIVGASTYKNLSGNLGLPVLYGMINESKDFNYLCDRTFIPQCNNEVLMFEKNKIPIFGLEHKRSLLDYDIILFSTSAIGYEVNVLRMLSLCGIPLESKDRDESYPIIMRGGQAIWSPEPLAPAMDIQFVGEAEKTGLDVFTFIRDNYTNLPQEKRNKEDLFHKLATTFRGIYPPSLYEPIYEDVGEYEILNEPKIVNWSKETGIGDVTYETVDDEKYRAHKNKCTTPKFKGWKKKFDDLPDQIKKADQWFHLSDSYQYVKQIVPYVDPHMGAGTLLVSRGCYGGCYFCLEENTMISTSLGLKKLKDLSYHDRLHDLNGDLVKIEKIFPAEEKDTLIFTLKNGMTIESTPDHRHLDIEACRFKEKLAADYVVGDYLLFSEHFKFADDLKTSGNLVKTAFALGWLLGDGTNNTKISWFVHESEIEVLDKIIDFLQSRKYSYRIDKKARGVAEVVLNRKKDREDFRETFSVGYETGRNKKIFSYYYTASLGETSEFLNGLFSSDGTVGKYGKDLSYKSISRDLVEGIAQLLTRYGIMPRIDTVKEKILPVKERKYSFTNFQPEHYRCFVPRVKDRVIFNSYIKLAVLKKRNRLAKCVFTDCQYYEGSYLHGVKDQLLKFVNESGVKDFKSTVRVGLSKNLVTKFVIDSIREKLDFDDGVIDSKLNSIEIVEIRKSKSRVIDINVERTHTFIANGIVTHNCQEGFTSLPYREYAAKDGLKFIAETTKHTGAAHPMISAYCSSSYTQRKEMVSIFLSDIHSKLSFISQRVDECSNDEDYVAMTRIAGNKSVALGVEGVNQRLRNLVSKNCSEEELLRTVEYFIKNNYKKIKMYCMNNLPFEKPEDYREGMELFEKVLDIRDRYSQKRIEIQWSFSPLQINPFVPFQFAHTNLEKKSLYEFIYGYTDNDGNHVKGLREYKGRLQIRIGSGGNYGEAYYQSLCHLGDRRVYKILEWLALDEKHAHYGVFSRKKKIELDQKLKSMGLSFDYYFREKDISEVYPWDIIDIGIKKEWFWKRYLKIQNHDIENGTKCIDKCRGCGVCSKEELEWRANLNSKWAADSKNFPLKNLKLKHERGIICKVRIKFSVDERHRFIRRKYIQFNFRRATYFNEYPAIKMSFFLGSGYIKMYNYFYGNNYIDIDFYNDFDDLHNKDKFIDNMNKHLQPFIRVSDCEFYWDNVRNIRDYSDTVFYKFKSPIQNLDETNEKLKSFLSLPTVDKTPELKSLKDSIESCYATYKTECPLDRGESILDFWNSIKTKLLDPSLSRDIRKIRSKFLKSNPQIIRVNEMDHRGSLNTIYMDGRNLTLDLWAKEINGEIFVYSLLQRECSAFHIIQQAFSKNRLNSFSYSVKRIDFVDYDETGFGQDSLFGNDCVSCGSKVFVDILNNHVGDPGKCLKCSDL